MNAIPKRDLGTEGVAMAVRPREFDREVGMDRLRDLHPLDRLRMERRQQDAGAALCRAYSIAFGHPRVTVSYEARGEDTVSEEVDQTMTEALREYDRLLRVCPPRCRIPLGRMVRYEMPIGIRETEDLFDGLTRIADLLKLPK